MTLKEKFEEYTDQKSWQQKQYSTEEKHIGHTINEFDKTYIKGFNDGAKWQQERSYSEEEVLVILHKRDMYEWEKENEILSMINWFKQFKKK